MKKIVTLMAAIMVAVAAWAEGAEITFDRKAHDFGNIQSKGGLVTTEYTFTNTGDAPLIIISADAKCGCTRPDYPVEPIAPGQKGTIKVSFNPLGYAGEVTKNITVRTNDKKNKKVMLKLECVVIP